MSPRPIVSHGEILDRERKLRLYSPCLGAVIEATTLPLDEKVSVYNELVRVLGAALGCR